MDTKVMAIEEAKKTGAIALFGEKYGDTVRVVDMGGVLRGVLRRHPSGQHRQGRGCSTSSSEFSVASGVRRIEATTGPGVPGRDEPQPGDALPGRCQPLKAKPGELRDKAEQQS